MQKSKSKYEKNLSRVVKETILTSIGAGFCIPVITVFFNSIGMNQMAIGFSQMMFTVVMVCLDIPMGYLADRFNRKVLNVIGDIGVALVFLFYACAKNLYMVVLAESLLGIFTAMTNGVDQSFIKYNANKIDESGKLFKKITARLYIYRYIMIIVVMLIGSFIAKYSLRLTIALSFLPYLIGSIYAFKIEDYAEKIEVKHSNHLKDMTYNMKKILKTPKVKTYIASYILGKEVTHAQIWVFTPLMLMVGVPIEIVSFGWILSYIMQIIGAKIAEKMIDVRISTKFVIPMILSLSWMMIIIIKTNIFTIWLIGINGLVQGLTSGSLITPMQEVTKDEVQTTVLSIASTGARLLYIPLVYIINYLGNIHLQYAFVGVITIFLVPSIIVFALLKKIERENTIS